MEDFLYVHPDDVPRTEKAVSEFKYSRENKMAIVAIAQKLVDENPTMNLDAFIRRGVAVPKGFRELLKHIDKSVWNGSIAHHEDNLAMVLSIVAIGDKSDKWIDRWQPMPTEKMRWISLSWFKLYATVLKRGTEQGAVIEVGEHDFELNKCRQVRLTEKYSRRSLVEYRITDITSAKNLLHYRSSQLVNAFNEPRKRLLMGVYPRLTVPSIEMVIARGTELVKAGYAKKGRSLVKLGRKTKADFLKQNGFEIRGKSESHVAELFRENFYSLEDHIQIFENHLANGWRFPNQQSCGRVDDSMTSLPEWIRLMFRFGSENVVEIDCVALHVNLLYPFFKSRVSLHAQSEFLCVLAGDAHSKIAFEIGVERTFSKSAANKYLNQRNDDMKNNPVDAFFQKNLPEYRICLFEMKKSNHKKMSHNLFGLESDIVWETMFELEKMGIPCYQVFDCIGVPVDFRDIAKQVLDECLKKYDVPTYSKY